MHRAPSLTTSPLAAALALAAVVLALVAVRFHVQTPARVDPQNLDLFHVFQPNSLFLNMELAEGRLAAWNPYQLAGQPWLAMHHPGALYPPKLIAHQLAGPARAEEALFAVHLWLAGFFTWLFIGRLGGGAPARWTAAIIYASSGKLLFGAYAPYTICTHAWLPAMLWSVELLAIRRRPDDAVALAVTSALAFLGGHSQGFLFAVTLTGAYGAARWWTVAGARARLRTLALAALAGALALALVAPQLLPSWELTTQSVRSFSGQTFEAASHPVAPAAMLGKGLLGTLGVEIFGASAVEWGWGFGAARHKPPLQWSLTVPLLTLPLAFVALAARRTRRRAAFFAAAAVLSGLYALGDATPLFRWAYQATPYALFRGPIRVDFAYVFAAAVLCALGVQALAEWARRDVRPGVANRRAWIAPVAMLTIAFGAATRSELPLAHPAVSSKPPGPPELVEFARQHAGAQRIFLEIDQDFEDRALIVKFGQMRRVFTVPDYEAASPAVYQRFFGFDLYHPWLGSVTTRGTRAGLSAANTVRMLDLMSVRHYVFPTTLAPDDRARLVDVVGGPSQPLGEQLEVVERRQALPRAYTVTRVRAAGDHDAELDAIRHPQFAPRREAVVADATDALRLGIEVVEGHDHPPAPRRRAAIIGRADPSEVIVDAECSTPCWLVVTDLDYPGWIATVDGDERPIHRTNALFRGVGLEPGAHRVTFRYEPAPLSSGLALAMGGFVACVGILVLPLGRRG